MLVLCRVYSITQVTNFLPFEAGIETRALDLHTVVLKAEVVTNSGFRCIIL